MIEPVSKRTLERIETLSRDTEIAGQRFRYCPCRLLPETVLSLKTVMRDIERLWKETLGAHGLEALRASPDGARFLAGEVRMTIVQEGRPEMVAVWLPVPPDYPWRLKVQLIDAVEPHAGP